MESWSRLEHDFTKQKQGGSPWRPRHTTLQLFWAWTCLNWNSHLCHLLALHSNEKKTKIHWNNWCSPVDVAISSRCFWAIYSNNLPNVYNSFSNLQTSSHHHPIPRVNGITTCRTFLLYIHTSFQEHLDNFKITLHDSHVDRINCFSSGEASTSPAQSMPTTERN